MMKIKVLKQFHDKETNQLYKVGDIVEVSDKRGTEIVSNSFSVAEIFELGKPDEQNDGGADDLKNLTVDQLKAKAEELGIDTAEMKTEKEFIKAIKKALKNAN